MALYFLAWLLMVLIIIRFIRGRAFGFRALVQFMKIHIKYRSRVWRWAVNRKGRIVLDETEEKIS